MSQVMSSLSQTVGNSAPIWVYRIANVDYGPMTSAVMATWLKEGWFSDDALPLRTVHDEHYFTLGDYKAACGGQNPFVLQQSQHQRPFPQPAPQVLHHHAAMGPFINGTGPLGMGGGGFSTPVAPIVRMPHNGTPHSYAYRPPSQPSLYAHHTNGGAHPFPPPTLAAVEMIAPKPVHINARAQTEPITFKAGSVEEMFAKLFAVRVKIVVESEEEETEGTIDEQSVE